MAPVLKTGIVRNKELSRRCQGLSLLFLGEDISFGFAWLFSIIKGNGLLSQLAEPEKKTQNINEKKGKGTLF